MGLRLIASRVALALALAACASAPTASPSAPPSTLAPAVSPSAPTASPNAPPSTLAPAVSPSAPTASPNAPPSTLAPTVSPNTPTASPSAPTPTPPPPPRLVIISIDGLRPDALQQTAAPNLLGLAQRGAYTFLAQTIFPPVTLPSHTSMLTGYLPETHRVDWNDYQPERGPIVSVPTIFGLAHAAGLRTAMVAGKEKFKHFDAPGALDAFVYATNGDQEVVDQAIALGDAYDLMVVHLPNTDYFGHSSGWMTGVYLFQITRTDEAVGRLLAALPPGTTVIVTADHGGHGLVHGEAIPEDMTIPWLIVGPGVKPGLALTTPVVTVDTAATALYVLGLPVPEDLAGRPVLEAFAP